MLCQFLQKLSHCHTTRREEGRGRGKGGAGGGEGREGREGEEKTLVTKLQRKDGEKYFVYNINEVSLTFSCWC